ncbi:MAG: hypothetical protein ACYC4S_09920 [Rhodoferax sp.]
MENRYTEKHFREILEPCGLDRYFIIDERGVWPKVERDLIMLIETELLRWRPARSLKKNDVLLDIADTPMLPFPFNARELAAFLLAGPCALVADSYGEWSDGPDQDSLNQIAPDSMARTALSQAFAAYREAKAATTTEPGDQPNTDAMVLHLLKLAPEENIAIATIDGPAKPRREIRMTCKDFAMPYLVTTFKSSQFASAKDFYQALKNKVGTDGSPFDLATGPNRGSLFVRDLGKVFALKTLENAMPEIRNRARLG